MMRNFQAAGLAAIAVAGLAAAGLTLSGPAADAGSDVAVATPWAEDHASRIRLVLGEAAADGPVTAALEIELEDGWKTYWREPGDAGLPPVLDWSGSTNLADATLHWPTPKRFTASGFDSFGYAERLIVPVTLARTDPAAPGQMNVQVDYAVCADLCVPVSAALSAELPAGALAATAHQRKIDRARASLPVDGPAVRSASLAPAAAADGALTLTLVVDDAALPADVLPADALIADSPGVGVGRPVIAAGEGGVALRFPIRPPRKGVWPQTGSLHLLDGETSRVSQFDWPAPPAATGG